MLRLSGSAPHTGRPATYRGIVTSVQTLPIAARHRYVLLAKGPISAVEAAGFQAVLCDDIDLGQAAVDGPPLVTIQPWMRYVTDGDVVGGDSARNWFRVMYRGRANANTFLLTERCNSNCVMCSQPPKAANDDYLVDEVLATIPLIPQSAREIGISGGEPLLLGERFIEVLRCLRAQLPRTSVHVLTNGRLLSYVRYAQKIAQVGLADLMLGIPVYSDLAESHDFVVQAKGAFDQTIRGILNAKRCGIKVEIRVVLHSQTVGRLVALAKYLARNLPFVDHVALMGMENIGHVKMNRESLAIDPADYGDALSEAVQVCTAAGFRTSIYNLQLCVLPESIRTFAVQSISDWKNDFAPACEGCPAKSMCAGFFTWNVPDKSRNYHPLTLAELERIKG